MLEDLLDHYLKLKIIKSFIQKILSINFRIIKLIGMTFYIMEKLQNLLLNILILMNKIIP